MPQPRPNYMGFVHWLEVTNQAKQKPLGPLQQRYRLRSNPFSASGKT